MIDTGSKTFNISKDDPKSSTPFEKFNESNRQSFGFGLQASGPLSTKTAMANIRFHGRQFAIATQEKVLIKNILIFVISILLSFDRE